MINLKNFDYEFDLNGFVVLKNVVKLDKIKLANKILANIEKKKGNLDGDVFFGKSPSNQEAYISNVLSAGKVFEDLAIIPEILRLLSHVTSNFFRLNHAVAMTKFK